MLLQIWMHTAFITFHVLMQPLRWFTARYFLQGNTCCQIQIKQRTALLYFFYPSRDCKIGLLQNYFCYDCLGTSGERIFPPKIWGNFMLQRGNTHGPVHKRGRNPQHVLVISHQQKTNTGAGNVVLTPQHKLNTQSQQCCIDDITARSARAVLISRQTHG